MEERKNLNVAEKEFTEIPSLIRVISANDVPGFDSVEETQHGGLNCSTTRLPTLKQENMAASNRVVNHEMADSVSITMPPFPVEVRLQSTQGVFVNGGTNDSTADFENACHVPRKFHSQRIQNVSAVEEGLRTRSFRDPRFDSFKTWSGKLEWQITHLGRKQPSGAEPEEAEIPSSDAENIPVERYYDALVGPELDTLRDSEEILLPDDQKWPFLLRFPISSFGICLGLSSQAIMWKALANSSAATFPHLNLKINLFLWSISVALIAIISFTYLLKMIIFFEAVRREYYHPIRINFFFAPWIALLFLALGVPPSIATKLNPTLWYILMAPILCLEIKIYGQWMSGGQRRLSKVANPSNHLSIVGNFVGALLGASMGLKEGPIFFFAVGIAHYTVLFVTLYQRLPTNETLPKELHPVFFLFVAAPSVASMAWAKMHGSFDYGSRIAYFIAMFLYFSLAVRVNFFRGFKFSLAWWAYTFPMTGAAIATIRYSNEVSNFVTRSLSILLSVVATVTVSSLLLTTMIHAFVLRDLFPNDIAIAIRKRKPKSNKKWFNLRNGSSQSKDVEKFFKFSCLGVKDLEASPQPSTIENR